jgi:Holliday junction resolvasome RuvABC endonuclease subunit
MAKKILKIIGINPGTRYMGIAVFYGSELRDWQVKNMEGRWSKDKMGKFAMTLSSLIDSHESDILAIKRPHPSRSSPNLNRLVKGIKELSRRKGLRVYEYSMDEIRKYLNPEAGISKRKLVEMVTLKYPLLRYELSKERANMNPYYVRMFEAVALGSLCLNRLKL